MEGPSPWPGERAYWRSVWQSWLGSAQQKADLQKEAGQADLHVEDEQEHVDHQEDGELDQNDIRKGAVVQQVDLQVEQEESEQQFMDCMNMESGVWSMEYEPDLQQGDLQIELQEVDLHSEAELYQVNLHREAKVQGVNLQMEDEVHQEDQLRVNELQQFDEQTGSELSVQTDLQSEGFDIEAEADQEDLQVKAKLQHVDLQMGGEQSHLNFGMGEYQSGFDLRMEDELQQIDFPTGVDRRQVQLYMPVIIFIIYVH